MPSPGPAPSKIALACLALGLSLAEVKELNAVYAISGSTRDMLQRLDGALDHRLSELDARIRELHELRGEIGSYRDRVRQRIGADEGPANRESA